MTEISIKKNYILGASSGMIVAIFSNALAIISVPIALNYWGNEKYGMWAVINSIIVYLSVSNLGLNAATSILMGKNQDINDKLKIFKKSVSILIGSAFFVAVLFAVTDLITNDWINIIGKIPAEMYKEVRYSMIVLVIFFLISLPLSLLSSAFGGFQKVYIENVFTLIDRISSFVVILGVVFFKGDFVTYALAESIKRLGIGLIKGIYFYRFIKKQTFPLQIKKNNTNQETTYTFIFKTGMMFFISGIMASIYWNADNLIIAHLLTTEDVTRYSITYKLVYLVITGFSMLLAPQVTLISREFGLGNWDWINRITNIFLPIIIFIGGISLVFSLNFFRNLIMVWTGKDVYAGFFVTLFLAGYAISYAITSLSCNVANGCNFTKHIYVIVMVEAILSLLISYFATIWIGIAGVALGRLASGILFTSWAYPLWVKKFSNNKFSISFRSALPDLIVLIIFTLLCGFIQFFVHQSFVRNLLGTVILIVYIVLGWNVMHKQIRSYIINNTKQFVNKVLNSIGILKVCKSSAIVDTGKN